MMDGSYHAVSRGGASVSLAEEMPPIYQQALQGTCVTSATTALLEYYGDCRTRLSVQFLHAATKEIERAGLERNLASLRAGGPLDSGFEVVFHAELQQLRLLADANGGMDVPAVRPYLDRFVDGARTRFVHAPGCLLMSCFKAVETSGVCRYSLWPYASARATPVFGQDASGELVFPPGTREDAAKRRVMHGLYQLGTPNNVDEIRGILAGANGRRPMPVVVTVDFFAECDGETYTFPGVENDAEGHLVSKNAWQGRHGLLVVGSVDSPDYMGGGYFLIRNSLGESWGNRGYGKLPYAYLECFALEAGTILQDRIDYEGDGYGGQRAHPEEKPAKKQRLGRRIAVNGIAALALVVGTISIGIIFDDPLGLRRRPKNPSIALESEHPSAGEESSPQNPAVTNVAVEAALEQGPRQTAPESSVTYKVFFSCEANDERKALRTALASEGVPFVVEFMQQRLETVLAVRITLTGEDLVGPLAEVLSKSYEGPRREYWSDVATLVRLRRIYMVRDSLRRWSGGR